MRCKMKKLLIILTIMFLLFLSISSVQAIEDNQNTTSADNIVAQKTFESIQNTINQSRESDTVILDGTYSGSGNEITIDKSIILKGTDNTKLNANGKSRILHIIADNVIIENIAFINGYDYDGGAGILIESDNIKIINCSFTNNNVDMYGAGILCEGDNVSISNCIFTKNTAKYTGGAVQLDGDNNRVDNCIFLSNTGGHVGGAVAWVGNNGILTSSQFISSGPTVASQYGGAIVWIGNNGTLTQSIFSKNNAKKAGAAVYWRGLNGTLNYCIFEDNNAQNDIAYWGNPEYANYNYWGFNINSSDVFNETGLITSQSPKNWINIEATKEYVKFILNNGEDINGIMPDYKYSSNITVHNNIYIFPKSTSIICSGMTVYAINAKTFKLTLKDENGNLLASKKINVMINNKIYKIITEKNGIASLAIKLANSGIYDLKVIFSGDTYYKSTSKTVKITVKKQTPKITIKNGKMTIKVTLKDQFKKAMAQKKIKLTINKKTFVKKTNKKGIVTFKLKLKNKKKYNAVVKFTGNNSYKSVSKKATIKWSG